MLVKTGSFVKLKDLETGEVYVLKLVEKKANFLFGEISTQSPVGAAILEKEIGEVVEVNAPDGALQYQILEVLS